MSTGMLAGRVALVTGAGRGIGAAAARLFAAEGAAVVLAARSSHETAAVAEEIRDAGGDAHAVVADVATADGVDAAVGAVTARHGRLDLALNNAGVSTRHVPITDLTPDEFDHVHGVNVRGTFLALAAELRVMGPGGAIVNVSSVGSWRGAAGGAAYGAAKRAVNSLTESAAIECGPRGIRVNAVVPGPTRTAMIARWQAADPTVTDALVARTPLGASPSPTRSPRPRPGCSPTAPRSSPAPCCPSTAASAPERPDPGGAARSAGPPTPARRTNGA